MTELDVVEHSGRDENMCLKVKWHALMWRAFSCSPVLRPSFALEMQDTQPIFDLPMQILPGFRDFYPDDCARRNYILAVWRDVARRYGFVEYDGPMLESVELYKKKSGGELLGQLFDFHDKGERHVTLRPEMTPTLARMVGARERDFKKPMKWFCVPQFFRYEKPQRGRGREFYQFNADIIGEASYTADAELIAVVIDLLRAFGFGSKDFVVRVSDRNAWAAFAAARTVSADRLLDFLSVVDKLERASPEESAKKLGEFGISIDDARAFIANPGSEATGLREIQESLRTRGLDGFIELDLSIVRGLAYYNGFVFEVFDRGKNERALAGGGRYDGLLSLMSDGRVNLPALGFGMGDVVLANLIDDTPHAKAKMDAWISQSRACDIYAVIANEKHRADALGIIQMLRDSGLRVDFPLTPAKVGKQFQTAEQLGARLAVIIGDEWPGVKIKTLATREEILVPHEELCAHIAHHPKS
jgi:histidyl-tRNA synthetase